MKKLLLMKRLLVLLVLMNCIISANASEITSNWKISGYVISDFYHITKSDSNEYTDYKPKEFKQINQDFEGNTGFQIRRIYLTFDNTISDNISARIRFEMGNTPFAQTKMEPFIKDAYLKWKINKNHNLYYGIQGSAAFGLIEKFWGYRIMQKTASDYYGIRSSRDFGIGLKGKIAKKVGYHVIAGNGESNKSEKTGDMTKLYAAAFDYSPIKNLTIQVYGDALVCDNRDNETTSQIFTGYKSDLFRIGFQFTHQTNVLLKSTQVGTVDLIAVPLVIKINDKFNAITQFTKYTVSEAIDYDQMFVVTGIDFHPVKNVNIMPNIEIVQYNFDGEPTKTDLVSKLTVSYKFK